MNKTYITLSFSLIQQPTLEREMCVCVCLQISAISLGSNFEQKIAEENVDSNNKILKV